MDGNALLPPPSVKVPTATQGLKRERLQHRLVDIEQQLHAHRQDAATQLDDWIGDYRHEHPGPTVPEDSLLHCPLDEDAGDVVHTAAGDAIGNVIGSLAWDAAHDGGGLRLDGQTHVELGDQCGFDRGTAFSATAWIYLDGEGAMTVLSRMDDAEAFRGYDLYLGDGRLFVHLIHHWDTNAIRVNTRQPLVRQKWQHVCFTYDGSSRAAGIQDLCGRPTRRNWTSRMTR